MRLGYSLATLAVVSIAFISFTLVPPRQCAAQKNDKDKKEKRRPKPGVEEVKRYIPRKPWVAAVPAGAGFRAACGIMQWKGGKERPIEDEEELDQLNDRAIAYRDSVTNQARTKEWSDFVPGAIFVQSEHFEIVTDLAPWTLQAGCGDAGAAKLEEVGYTYAERAERIWQDFANVFGLEAAESLGRKRIFIWNKTDAGRIKRNKVNSVVFKDYLTKDHQGGGSDHRSGTDANMWADPGPLPEDEDVWEHFVHLVAGVLLSSYSSYYGGDDSNWAWLDEGWAFYLTRIHREHDNCTTMMFQEGFEGKVKHIGGGEAGWLGHVKALVKAGVREDGAKRGYWPFKDILTHKVNQMDLDERAQGWSMVKFLIDVYGKAKFRDFIALVAQREKPADAIKNCYSLTLKQWENEWLEWLEDPTGFAAKKRAAGAGGGGK